MCPFGELGFFQSSLSEPVLTSTVVILGRGQLDQSEDARELERKIKQASRIASTITDQTTLERLRTWADELRQRLRQLLEARHSKQEIRTRARELWEKNGGRPLDRD